MEVTQESLELAIDKVRPGNRLFDICGTVEKHVVSNGFSVVREYVGHGIGTQLHEEPQIPNYVDRKNENPRLKEGMVLAIEPMVNAGGPDVRVLPRQVDGRHEGWPLFGPLRALRGRHGGWTVGFDEAVKDAGEKEFAATVVELLPSAMYRVELETREQVLAHAVGRHGQEFCSHSPRRSRAGGAIAP